MLTIQDVAERLRVSSMTVRRMWYENRIPEPIRIRGSIRWREQDIAEWIDAGCPITGVTENV